MRAAAAPTTNTPNSFTRAPKTAHSCPVLRGAELYAAHWSPSLPGPDYPGPERAHRERPTGFTEEDVMMVFRKALLPVAIGLLFVTYLPAANTILVHGPTVFTVHSGPPTPETVSFALPKLVYGPFTLLVDHKDVTGVNLELNGAPYIRFASLSTPSPCAPLSICTRRTP